MYPNGPKEPQQAPDVPQSSAPRHNELNQSAQQTASPGNAPTGSAMFQVQPPQRNKKKTILVATLITLGSLIVIIAALLYVFLVVLKPAPEAVEEEAPALKSSLFVQGVRETLKDKYPQLSNEEGKLSDSPRLRITDLSPAPAYQPEGYQYYTTYDSEAAFAYELTVPEPATVGEEIEGSDDLVDSAQKAETEAASIAVVDIIIGEYAEAGLVPLEENDGDTAKEDTSISRTYTGRSIVCLVTAQNTERVQKGTVSCGDEGEYVKRAAEIQPFADNLTNVTLDTTLKYLSIAESDAGGYQNATMQVVDEKGKESTAYFYKKGAGRWLHFITTSDKKIGCSKFSSLDAQRAFINTPCHDSKNASATVKIVEKR